MSTATCAFAQENAYDDAIDASPVSGTPDRPNAIVVKPFFALGLDDLYSNVGEKVDLYGLNVDYTRILDDGPSGSVEFVGLSDSDTAREIIPITITALTTTITTKPNFTFVP